MAHAAPRTIPSAVKPDPVPRIRASRYPSPPPVILPPTGVDVIAQPVPMPDHASLLRGPSMGGGHSKRLPRTPSNPRQTRFRWSEGYSVDGPGPLVKVF